MLGQARDALGLNAAWYLTAAFTAQPPPIRESIRTAAAPDRTSMGILLLPDDLLYYLLEIGDVKVPDALAMSRVSQSRKF